MGVDEVEGERGVGGVVFCLKGGWCLDGGVMVEVNEVKVVFGVVSFVEEFVRDEKGWVGVVIEFWVKEEVEWCVCYCFVF